MWLIQTGRGSDLLHLLEGNWWPTVIAMVCLVVMIWLIVRLVARVNDDSDPAAIAREMLTSMNDLHREGDLTQDEYRSIKGQLVRRLQEPAAAPDSAAAGDTATADEKLSVKAEQSASPEESAPTNNITKSENIPAPQTDNEANDRDQADA